MPEQDENKEKDESSETNSKKTKESLVRTPSTSIESVRIRNYKNITDTGMIDLTNINALIGKNEVGKTTILEAIKKLSNTESVSESAIPHEMISNKKFGEIPIVEAKFQLTRKVAEEAYSIEEEEFESINFPVEFEMTKYADGSRNVSSYLINTDRLNRIVEMAGEIARDRKKANQALSTNEKPESDIIIRMVDELRNIKEYKSNSTKQPTISDVVKSTRKFLELSEEAEQDHASFKEITSGFREHLDNMHTGVTPPEPTVLFYENIDIIPDYLTVGEEFQEESYIFKRMLSIGGFTEDEYKRKNDKIRYLDTIAREIKSKINSVWSQKNVDITLMEGEGSKIELYFRDITASDSEEVERELTKPSERSDGFRWFFSFYVDVLAKSETTSHEEKILLFDDPAVYLHPEGKRDWLDMINNEIGTSEQVIYTSHSPYLIDKRYPHRIKIVEDKNGQGTTVSSDIMDPEADPDSLEPLRNALGIKLGDSPFLSKKTVLVEGPSDYYILTGVMNYFDKFVDRRHFNIDKISINPSNGASQMPKLASWLSAQEIDFAMMLDSDDEGQKVKEKVENNRYLGVDTDDLLLLEHGGSDVGTIIEDLFPVSYYLESFNPVFNKIAAEEGQNYRYIISEESDVGHKIGVKDSTSSNWEIGPIEYDGTGLDEVLSDIMEEQPIADSIRNDEGKVNLHKRTIAENIQNRLENGDIPSDDLRKFNRLLGKIGSILDI